MDINHNRRGDLDGRPGVGMQPVQRWASVVRQPTAGDHQGRPYGYGVVGTQHVGIIPATAVPRTVCGRVAPLSLVRRQAC